MIAAFRDSILAARGIPVASVRAGNVIGGGDPTRGRLVPDLIRAALGGEPLEVRAPRARRPWQHVLNPLEGYLLLAERLADDPTFATAWNFGPSDEDSHPVEWIVERMRARWPGELDVRHAVRPPVHEAAIPGWTPPAPARASAGARRGTSRRRSRRPSTGISPSATAATPTSSRWSRSSATAR